MKPEQLRGGLLGLLIGDALGVPYEFHVPENIPPLDQIELEPPAGFNRSHRHTPPGTWSDDGAQALCLLASLLDCGRLDLEDLAGRFKRWADEGYLAVDGRMFDIGNQTTAAVARIGRLPALQCGGSGEWDNGNGSLMRVLPLALWHRGTDAELVSDARDQSRITHAHPRSTVACALYCLWARRLAAGAGLAEAVEAVRPHLTQAERAELPLYTGLFQPTGSGYVLDAFHSAKAALQHPTYERVVREAIAFGLDTDTTACIAGGLAGLRGGDGSIPIRWKRALRGQSLLQPLLDGLLAHWEA